MASADCQLDAAAAGFAVDADAHFHLVLAELEGRLAGGRHGAAGKRDAHGAGLPVHALWPRCLQGFEVRAFSAAAPSMRSTISVPATPRRPVE